MKQVLNDIQYHSLMFAICCSILFVVSMVIGLLAKWCGATNLGGVFATGWLCGIVCVVLIGIGCGCKLIEKVWKSETMY